MNRLLTELGEELELLGDLVFNNREGNSKNTSYYYNLGRLESKHIIFNKLKNTLKEEVIHSLEEDVKVLDYLIIGDVGLYKENPLYYYNLGRLEDKKVMLNKLKDILKEEK